jgi:hypothetical protein
MSQALDLIKEDFSVVARKDKELAANQASITIVGDVMPCSGGGGLIQTSSGWRV